MLHALSLYLLPALLIIAAASDTLYLRIPNWLTLGTALAFFPMALAIAFLVITGAYFFMYHVFNAQGVVSVIIEMFGGLAFLAIILKKGAL